MSRITRSIILVTALVLILSAVLPVFAQEPLASVNTGSLNVRSGPGLQFGSITTLPFGFGVRLLGRNAEGNWVFIGLTNGVQGWANVNYLYTFYPIFNLPINNSQPASNIVPTATVNGIFTQEVRDNPSTSRGGVVGTIQLGETVQLIGRSFDSQWAQVRLPNGVTGWVQAVNIIGSVPVRSLTITDGAYFAPLPPNAVPGFGFARPGQTQQPPAARTHVIAAGETLFAIAQRYNVDMYTLAAANGIINIDRIYAGQTLIIP